MNTNDAYGFGHQIAGYARERAARLTATHADPDTLAAEIARQCDAPATRALSAKLMALKLDGMTVPDAEAWAQAAERGYREGMAEGERVH